VRKDPFLMGTLRRRALAAEGEGLVRAQRIYTRRTEARKLREEAAELAFLRPHPDHISNAEEAEYRRPNGELSYIANYSKALEHDRDVPAQQAGQTLLAAV
jgi:hypothetical protein